MVAEATQKQITTLLPFRFQSCSSFTSNLNHTFDPPPRDHRSALLPQRCSQSLTSCSLSAAGSRWNPCWITGSQAFITVNIVCSFPFIRCYEGARAPLDDKGVHARGRLWFSSLFKVNSWSIFSTKFLQIFRKKINGLMLIFLPRPVVTSINKWGNIFVFGIKVRRRNIKTRVIRGHGAWHVSLRPHLSIWPVYPLSRISLYDQPC